jgi:TrmH family RNA methyltransferase
MLRITTKNARFQQWESLLTNRNKRQRQGEFLVHGVQPITMAVQQGWEIRALLYDGRAALSGWARELLNTADRETLQVAMDPALLAELGEKEDATPEVVAVVGLPGDDLHRIPAGPRLLTVVFDRPSSPGNIGTLIRSADAFGASGVIVTGHAADVYDPKAVRASTGSLFALPVVRVPSHREVLDWVHTLRAKGDDVRVVGTDEHGTAEVAEFDLTGPTVLLIGNETAGLTAAWQEAADEILRIPMIGAATSLNAAAAGSVVLYEAARQRRSG